MNKFKILKQKQLSPKVIIIISLLIFSIVCYIFGTYSGVNFIFRSDFWINLSAGTVGSVITIFFIDSLINRGKLAKLKEVNKVAHLNTLHTTRLIMARFMIVFGYIKQSELMDILDNGEVKFEKFIKSDYYNAKINQLEKFNINTGDLLVKLQKQTESAYTTLIASLEEIKPYPDPKIMEFLQLSTPEFQGRTSVGIDIIKLFYNKLPKEVSKKEIKKMQPGMDVLWKIYSQGFMGSVESIKSQYNKIFDIILEINKKAKKEELFYEVG